MDDPTQQPTADHTTSACQFIGGPYDGRTIAVHDHVNTVNTGFVDANPDLRWVPELGGWISIAAPTDAPDLAGDPPVTLRTVRYERHGNTFKLADDYA